MKKRFIPFKNILPGVCLLALLALGACSQDDPEIPTPAQEVELTPVTLSFGARPETRAAGSFTDPGADDQIDNIWILQYEVTDGGTNTQFKRAGYVIPTWESGTSSWKAVVPLEATSGSTFQIYCLANSNDPALFENVEGTGFKTVEELKTRVKTLSITNGEKEMGQYVEPGDGTIRASLLMNGKLDDVTVTPGTAQIFNIELSRLCARITFTYTNNYSVEGRKLNVRGVQLKNVPGKLGYFAHPAVGSGEYINYQPEQVNDDTKGKSYTFTWFVPQHTLADNTTADPATATYIEVVGFDDTSRDVVTYRFYPHANNSGTYNFDLPAGSAFGYTADLKGGKPAGLTAKKHYSVAADACTIISDVAGAANCFIVQPGKALSFPLVQLDKYNTWLVDKKSGTPALENTGANASWTAEILWMDAPQLVELVKSSGTGITSDYILVNIPDPDKEGNAIIALKNGNGEIVWSWHLWVLKSTIVTTRYSPYNKDNGLSNSSGTANDDQNITSIGRSYDVMNYNLGATSLADLSGSGAIRGLYYQWGRKDPFPRSNTAYLSTDVSTPTYAFSTSAFASEDRNHSAELSVQHPDLFYLSNWPGSTTGSSDDTSGNNSWGGAVYTNPKSIFDPCPFGYRVPDTGFFGTELSNSWNWQTKFKNGYDWSTITRHEDGVENNFAEGPGVFPVSGNRYTGTGVVGNTGNGDYWSASPSGTNGYRLTFTSSNVAPRSSITRSYGFAVRCVAEY